MRRSVDSPKKALEETQKLVMEMKTLIAQKEWKRAKVKVRELRDAVDFLASYQEQQDYQAKLSVNLLTLKNEPPEIKRKHLRNVRMNHLRETMKTEYKVNTECMSMTVKDMEEILGVGDEVIQRRAEKFASNEKKKVNYLNILITRMQVFLEPFEEEERQENIRGIFDIMDEMRSKK